MIELKASIEAVLGDETIQKSYSVKLDTEVIEKASIEQFFQRALQEFLDQSEG